jgi:negative regulator of sigma E activity
MSSKNMKNGHKNNTGKSGLDESMSAFMDGEASEFEFHRLLRECSNDGALKQKWSRYHFLSAHLRGEIHRGSASFRAKAARSERLGHNLLSRIHNQLAKEGVPGYQTSEQETQVKLEVSRTAEQPKSQSQATRPTFSHLFWQTGQGAIAASVAVAVIISSQLLNQDIVQDTSMAASEQTSQSGEVLFNGNYAPTEFNRIPRLNASMSGINNMNASSQDRLRRAVYQEFVGETQEQIEIPVNFSVTRELQK